MNNNTTGRVKSMSLTEVIDMFLNLLVSNDPKKDIRSNLYTGIRKDVIRNFDCGKVIKKMTIKKSEEVVFETTDIDMMLMGLAYYEAYFMDKTSSTGFCWMNKNNEWYQVNFS